MVYDVMVIGGGPAGGTAAQKAHEAGMSAVLFEKKHLGGVCLNEGCIPSKTLLNCAKRYQHAKNSATYGVTTDNVRFDIRQAMARKEKVIQALRKGSESTKKKAGIPVISAQAEIQPKTGDLFSVKAGDTVYQGKRLVICTGSEAIKIPIPGADQPYVHTNREILSVDFIPRNLVVIGGGVIGLEFATFFADIGSSVTVVEMLPDIAGMLDADIRKALQREMEKKGVSFKLKARVTAVGDHEVSYTTAEGAQEKTPADLVLMSVGRRPVVKDFGLENISVLVEKGAVVTDDRGRTNIPGVWAAGDVNGRSMLAHTASREAEVCVDDMTGKKSSVHYDTIPSVIYTHPEVACVGLTAEQAASRGIDAVEKSMPLTYNGRYLAETDGERGVIKVVAERRFGTVLGVHMYGGVCSEMIHGAAVMIEAELRVQDVRDIVFAHPTVAEMIKDTIVEMNI